MAKTILNFHFDYWHTSLINHVKIDLPASVRSELEMNIHIMISELIVGGEALSTEVTPETHCITVGRETTTHL